jgi:dTDP-4-dehydrorhamnose 3,5-epimerase
VNLIETSLPGVLIIEPKVHGDRRGFFVETFQLERYRETAGIALPFVQDNHSHSQRGVLRGLHAQKRHPQGKLVRAARGSIFDVAVDIDASSPSFGRWVGATLSDENHRQLWVPPGYAHGFVVLADGTDVIYKCTDYYHPEDEIGVIWNDPRIAIEWPIDNPMLSKKDAELPTLAELENSL